MKVIYLDASKCPLCGSKKIGFNEKRNEFFCKNCGYILMDNVPLIKSKYKAKKVLVNPKKKKIAFVIKGILKSKTEKKMMPFYAEIKKFTLPKYVEAEILTLARKAVEEKLTMSFSKLEILSALIYHSCKREGIPILIKELEKTYGVKKKKILRCYKMISSKLNLKLNGNNNVDSYIIRISSDLGFNGALATEAIKISNKIKIAHPIVKSAVSIWLASKKLKLKIKKAKLAKVSGISEASLRRNISKQLHY